MRQDNHVAGDGMTESAQTGGTQRDAGSKPERTLSVVHSIADVGRDNWDACANPAATKKTGNSSLPSSTLQPEPDSVPETNGQGDSIYQDESFNPLISFDFLSSLEDSQCVGDLAGWWPHHLTLQNANKSFAGVMPAYVKNNSFGEYIFDHGWADAYERAGGDYYPKVQIAVPFSPVPGRRVLTASDDRQDFDALVSGAMALNEAAKGSSIHWTFCNEAEWNRFGKLGLLRRTDRQFHWFDRGYETFDDFLAALASRKRKTIRRERRQAVESGIAIECVTGSDLTEAHWDAFFSFYMDTGGRKWGRPYLNRTFFSLIGERMADRILLIMAKRDDRYIAGALNLIGNDALYGRHWGCTEHHAFLHFELCYYQAIDWALAHGLKRVEAGHQGEHKLARGYEPVPVYSAHYIASPGLRRAIADYLERERMMVDHEIEAMGDYTPFRKG